MFFILKKPTALKVLISKHISLHFWPRVVLTISPLSPARAKSSQKFPGQQILYCAAPCFVSSRNFFYRSLKTRKNPKRHNEKVRITGFLFSLTKAPVIYTFCIKMCALVCHLKQNQIFVCICHKSLNFLILISFSLALIKDLKPSSSLSQECAVLIIKICTKEKITNEQKKYFPICSPVLSATQCSFLGCMFYFL